MFFLQYQTQKEMIMYPITQYITNSVLQTFLFAFVFVVCLRGFLGLYEDRKNGKRDGKIYFAWFTLKNKNQTLKENETKQG